MRTGRSSCPSFARTESTCEAGDSGRAREDLRDARRVAALPIARVAARSAYDAMFHAAEALIFERTGRAAKTHSGVRSLFAQSTKALPSPDRDLAGALARTYEHKELADYGTDPGRVITDQIASEAIDAAQHFIGRVAALLAAPHPGAKG